MARELCWINGAFFDLAEGKISIEDRGFQFGDGVYEVIRIYSGKPFLLDRHLQRLKRSMAMIEIKAILHETELEGIAKEMIKRSGYEEAELYVQVTRGTAARDHIWLEDIQPTVLFTIRAPRKVPQELRLNGAKAITVEDIRWGRCDIKAIGLLPNVLAKKKAQTSSAYEAIFIRNGIVMEATSSNVFLYQNGEVFTPIADNRILNGITRQFLIENSAEIGIQVQERDIFASELYSAKEVFLTGTITEVLAVVEIDGQKIGKGVPGEVFQRYAELHRRKVDEFRS